MFDLNCSEENDFEGYREYRDWFWDFYGECVDDGYSDWYRDSYGTEYEDWGIFN